jgi:hypothetical protein
MGRLIRDDRQMKAVTGLSRSPFNSLLPAFSDIHQAAQQLPYEDGGKSSTRRCNPEGVQWNMLLSYCGTTLLTNIGVNISSTGSHSGLSDSVIT